MKLLLHHYHQLKPVFLKPGELFISEQPSLVSTILGSCLALTFFEPVRKVSAICHILLPSGPLDAGHKYLSSTLPVMLDEIWRRGASYQACQVKMFGGAEVLNSEEQRMAGKLSIGAQNVALAVEMLQELGISLAASDVGGSLGRKLYFDTLYGHVYVKSMVRKAVVTR